MSDEEIIAMARTEAGRGIDGHDVQILDKAEVEIILDDGAPIGAWVEARLWVTL